MNYSKAQWDDLLRKQETLFAPPDSDEAFDAWGANCGPHTVAALLRKPLLETRPLLEGFDHRHYMNVTHIVDALKRGGSTVRHNGTEWPEYGFAFLQIEGPWTAPGVPVTVAYRHTHSVGVADVEGDRFVYDANGNEWTPFDYWDREIMRNFLIAEHKKATGGYYVRSTYEVQASPDDFAGIWGECRGLVREVEKPNG